MTLDDLGEENRSAIRAIAAKHGVQRVRVFGSFARGEARKDSDLDLLIEAGPENAAMVSRRTGCLPGRRTGP